MTGEPGVQSDRDNSHSSRVGGMISLRFDTHSALQRGFTLIELMVTLVVVAVLLAIGVPSMSKLIASNRISTQTNEFVGALSLARAEAVRRSEGVSIRSKGGDIEFAPGWLVFRDPALTGSAPSAANILRESSGFTGSTSLTRVRPSGGGYVSESSSSSFLVFNSRGGNEAGGSAWFRVCDAGDNSIKGRILQVSTVGKVSVDNAAAPCP
jgi:type IV fimbrial biogenesis protein FimT